MSGETRPLGVAAIGYAFMGKAHSQAWRNVGSFFDVPAFERKVLVGRDGAQVAAAAERFGWQESATDWREVIARPDIDVVDICTPGWTHAEIAIAALEAGKHVLVEKPLSNTLEESQAMVEAATRAAGRGVKSMIGFNYRRVPALAYARNLIGDGRLGEIRQVRASYLQDWLADEQAPMSWRLRRETAGSGALGDIASHAIDQVQFLTGHAVTGVSARLETFVPRRPGPDGVEDVTVDDAAWLTLALDGGAVASVEASRMAFGRKNALRIEVYGSGGALAFDLERPNELQFLDGADPVAVVRGRAPGAVRAGRRRPVLRGAWRRRRPSIRIPSHPGGLSHGTTFHPLHRPVGRPDPGRGGRAGRRLGLRRTGDRGLR